MPSSSLIRLLDEIRACRHCGDLPLGPRPVVQAGEGARLLIIGQAPGTRVHASGIPWNDPSGERLRDWLQMASARFYDPQQVAIMPMGFCYPGKGRSGDLPPRPECAPLWHARLRTLLPQVQLTLLVGQYAQRYYWPDKVASLSERVWHYQQLLEQGFFPLPHPSPRNRRWLAQRPWFESTVLPALRTQINALFCSGQARK